MERLPAELKDEVFSHLGVGDVVRYSATSRRCFEYVADYISRRFSVLSLLRRFFSTDATLKLFCRVQRDLGVLVSGSQVTGLFTRKEHLFGSSDLDVYVNTKNERAFVSVLGKAGYRLFVDLTKPVFFVDSDDNDEDKVLTVMIPNEMVFRSKYVDSAIASVKEYRND
ncbi:uncharacterized protein EV420DRAFT_1636719 [Desarmillaria tabescens]|uniref:F-box domain-containing protein n=1 Tax=Armillaria tabescens TaxID=1929756 RepID=A0AA39NIF0_ARMTA|nr:uncharacterized protein EV420DRAFT_1636719 [Desarmillaria tabescens]KAK0466114.1 hypothetical protein EV420DRAFT_1636719 [Desarmillaria tabescens]